MVDLWTRLERQAFMRGYIRGFAEGYRLGTQEVVIAKLKARFGLAARKLLATVKALDLAALLDFRYFLDEIPTLEEAREHLQKRGLDGSVHC